MTEQEERVLTAVKQSPLATQQELADSLSMTRESIAGHIMRLTRAGYILGKGYIIPQPDTLLIIGGCNLDINGSPLHKMKLADSNPGIIQQSAGGVGRNIAENIARLNNQIHFLSIVGQDSSGDWLLEKNRQCGISTQDIIRHPEFNTSSYLSINDEKGQLVSAIADMKIIDALDAKRLESKMPLLQSTNRILIEANLAPNSIEWLSRLSLDVDFYADAVSASKAPRLQPILARLSLLKVNRDEAKSLLNMPLNNPITDAELAQAIINQGVTAVLLSLGSDGVLYKDEKSMLSIPVFPTTPVSDTGAGDALFAGFIHAQSKDWPLKERLEFAVACAGVTLECEQANDPNFSEETVIKWIKTKS
ncbi:PfkB family carbohydrate kinase [Marinomonas sp. 15G1-11]|uniref:PfkB family carbohydrate kinase n=1 Tax=Marinomonas phaeophyticola TaxID=3004091 RepID=A0ABT4JSF9_9GAMM|nr:PfkB family carbohydrate kinase [Marinomonas sp. 15G1-11]MCZ2721317.1 PfkB family carbohydrate kinase [Marinomonas sp. 15G1-11]